MKKYAILSDIHANVEALDAVFDDIDKRGDIDDIIVLGDTVGSGPNPKECWELISEEADVILIGAHDLAIATGRSLSGNIDETHEWTKRKLQSLDSWVAFARPINRNNYIDYAQEIYDGKTLVHASPQESIKQQIWPGHQDFYIAYNDQLDKRLQGFIEEFTTPHGFFGHTHIPTIMTNYCNKSIFDVGGTWNKNLTFIGPQTVFFVPQGDVHIKKISDKKVFINPGSVGRPRDGDCRASYAVYDDDSVTFVRVEYDIQATQKKLKKMTIDSETKEYLVQGIASGT